MASIASQMKDLTVQAAQAVAEGSITVVFGTLMTICTVMEDAPAPLSAIGKNEKHHTHKYAVHCSHTAAYLYIYFLFVCNSQAKSSVALQKGSNVLTRQAKTSSL